MKPLADDLVDIANTTAFVFTVGFKNIVGKRGNAGDHFPNNVFKSLIPDGVDKNGGLFNIRYTPRGKQL